jgi:hypothetical protein
MRTNNITQITRALLLAGLCSAASLPAFADAASDRVEALEKRLERSAQLVEKLAARVAELERTGKAAPAAAAVAAPAAVVTATATSSANISANNTVVAEQAKAIAALQETIGQISAGLNNKGADAGVPLHGFADVGAGWSKGDDPIKLRGFNAGTLDFYLTPQFSERTKSLIEFAVEYGQDGHAAFDLERLQLGYTVNDALTLWLGRYHTPMGLWNTSYHHGANLQTSISRPRFIDFEDKGGIVPAHSVGLWASGKTALGGGKFGYDVYVANGPSISERTLDFRAFNDDTSNKMVGLNFAYLPSGALAGLTVGVHAFASTVNTFDMAGDRLSSTKLRMTGAYAGYDENDWEVIAEYYRFSNSDAEGGGSRTSNAWFAQIGKTFGAVTPFVRFENASLNADDNFFRSQESGRSYRRSGVGLRYALDPKSSLKAEFANTRENAIDQLDENGASAPFSARNYKRLSLQYSVSF